MGPLTLLLILFFILLSRAILFWSLCLLLLGLSMLLLLMMSRLVVDESLPQPLLTLRSSLFTDDDDGAFTIAGKSLKYVDTSRIGCSISKSLDDTTRGTFTDNSSRRVNNKKPLGRARMPVEARLLSWICATVYYFLNVHREPLFAFFLSQRMMFTREK